MDSCEKISNSITAAKELIENEARSLAALHKAKQLEKELRKSGKLFRIPTINGIIETTSPEKYIEYNNQFKKPKKNNMIFYCVIRLGVFKIKLI